jgi:hypothetical protein
VLNKTDEVLPPQSRKFSGCRFTPYLTEKELKASNFIKNLTYTFEWLVLCIFDSIVLQPMLIYIALLVFLDSTRVIYFVLKY